MGGERRGITPSFLSAWPWFGKAGPLPVSLQEPRLFRGSPPSSSLDPSGVVWPQGPTATGPKVLHASLLASFSPTQPPSTVLSSLTLCKGSICFLPGQQPILRLSGSSPCLAFCPQLTLHDALATPGFFLTLQSTKLETSLVPLSLPLHPAWDSGSSHSRSQGGCPQPPITHCFFSNTLDIRM